MEFHQSLNDPNRWVIKANVPIFKSHQRVDPNTKQLIKVDPVKLQRIASNLQRMERAGVPIRMTLGHTEPGKPETEQPPVCGYYRNARVQPFGPQQEPAVVVDEWLDPAYLPNRKNYPFRSAEYYDDSEQITGVALLTRDPWLELGVVAYHKAGPGCTFYSRASEIAQPKHYHFLIGDSVMDPNSVPVPPFGASIPGAPPQPHPGYGASGGYINPGAPPVGYNDPRAPLTTPVPYGSAVGWNANYHAPGMNRPHPSGRGSAVYGRGGYGPRGGYGGYYANEPPSLSGGASGGGGMPPGMSGGGGGPSMGGPPPGMSGGGMPPGMSGGGGGGQTEVLGVVHDLLSQAVAALADALGGGGGAAPQSPFPPTANAGYARGPRGGGGYPQRRGGHYEDPRQPIQMARTISGLPVGYQLELDKRDAQIRDMQRAMTVLFYERDEADTQACVGEIQTLIARGFNVGEYEFAELKKKDANGRAAYLQHIMTKYEQGPGTDFPPPILGDPTPGQAPDQNRPMTREEMELAVDMSRGRPTADYARAVNYVRQNGGANRMSRFDQPPDGQFVENDGADDYQSPDGYPGYPEPSPNGNGRY